VQVRVVDVSRAADQPSFDEVPWLQPFPDRLLEDALLAATYAAAVPFLEIPRARQCLDTHGATITTCAVPCASPSADTPHATTCHRPLPQASDQLAHLAQAKC
jgi:hypothetical protein